MEERSSSARLFYAAEGMHRPDIIHEAEVCLASEMIKQDEQASPPITNRSHVRISQSSPFMFPLPNDRARQRLTHSDAM